MGDIIKMILALTVISAVAGMAIGYTNGKTEAKIAEQQRMLRDEAIKSVFPVCDTIVEMRDKGNEIVPALYWTAFEGDSLIGYAFEISGRGYAGDIKFMVGTDKGGKIFGINVLGHNETPGLGSRVNEIPSAKYIWNPLGGDEKNKPWFTEQFEGLSSVEQIGIDKSIGEWHKLDERARKNLHDRNAVTAITGSTISTAAFTKAIEQTVAQYIRELDGYCCPAAKRGTGDRGQGTENVNVKIAGGQ